MFDHITDHVKSCHRCFDIEEKSPNLSKLEWLKNVTDKGFYKCFSDGERSQPKEVPGWHRYFRLRIV